MKDTTSKIRRQGGDGDSPRPGLPYVQIPLCLLTLPTGERVAAIEVWAALHHHLRLGSRPERITDEELSTVPWLLERSRRYRLNGLDTLVRTGLIVRESGGSSRTLAIVARLRSKRLIDVAADMVKAPKLPDVKPRAARVNLRERPVPPVSTNETDLTGFWDRVARIAPKLHASVHPDAQKRKP